MATSLKSATSCISQSATAEPSRWVKLGIVAAASALVGGVAAAWWYRKTLTKLLHAEEGPSISHFGTPGDDSADDIWRPEQYHMESEPAKTPGSRHRQIGVR